MVVGILGKKLGMTQIFDEAGNAIPVTVVQAGPCVVTQIKSPDTDGYAAIQQGFELGQAVTAETFTEGQFVDVTGKSIGRGFAGYQKRHNFRRGPMAHGSKNHRQPGSTGAGTTPGRVYPGKRMAGQMGNVRVTICKLQVVRVDSDRNLLLIKGAIPGKPGGLLSIAPAKWVKA